VHANLAFALEAQAKKAEAQQAYAEALRLQPANTQIMLNYARLLAEIKQFDLAEKLYLQIVDTAENAQAWSNLGVLYARTHNTPAALECYARAIKLAPDYATTRFNRSYLHLLHGDFAQGWQDFEHRNWYAALAQQITYPRWQGEPLTGKTIFIGCEAGYGDMLQFCRYVPMLKQRGAAEIIFLCYPALKPLLATLIGVDKLYAVGEDFPDIECDYWTPLLSLPRIFNTQLDNIPANIPYLGVNPAKQNSWSQHQIAGKPRIGLVWQGSPRHENDLDRSMASLAQLSPLLQRTDIHWLSLQKPLSAQDQTEIKRWNVQHLGDDILDFADSAAIISQLDLLICVDTAVAHLAGALGIPCWIMLPAYQPDWRWLLDRQDSPWYPSVRLFRQSQAGEWASVVEEIALQLAAFIAKHA
jgi:Tetratricopeptide repeat